MKTSRINGMQIGSLMLGDQVIQGGYYENINSAGSIEAEGTTVDRLKIAGNGVLSNCIIQEVKVAGHASFHGGTIRKLEIAGDAYLSQDAFVEEVIVLGSLRAEHVRCRILHFGAKSNFWSMHHRIVIKGDLQGVTLENFFRCEYPESYVFENVVNMQSMLLRHNLSCERLVSVGSLQTPEITADKVYVFPNHKNRIGVIQGGEVIIHPMFELVDWMDEIEMDIRKEEVKALRNDLSYMNVQQIEADHIHLDYVKANIVRGCDIIINEHCHINKIEYSGSVQIDPKASVKEVVKV